MERRKKRRGLHIGVLILGAYMLFLGGGTLLRELAAIVLLGKRAGITFARALFGAALTGLGGYAVWDSVRDLRRGKEPEEAPPLQFVFTDTAGVSSSIVTPERVREQIGLVSEETRPVALQLVTPIPVAKLGELINMTYAHMEDGWFLAAIFRQGGGVQVRRKSAESGEAEAVMTALLEGGLPDLSAWERLEAAPGQRELRPKRRLLLTRDNGTSDHEFFTERDLDLAITGLADGTYRRVFVQNGPASVTAVPGADGSIALRLQFRTSAGIRAYRRTGMPNPARFWLVQFYDGSLFQLSGEGWEPADP